ncbi:MAG: hypothetical protein IKJ50_07355 [Clostridia bacterium]|nr:hypothetical protein [Clostridia bacterium]
MENKRQIALNLTFNLFIIVGLLSLWGGIRFLTENVKDFGYFFCGIAALFILVPIIIFPYCYIFDSEGVTFKRIFFRDERYLWDNIYRITSTIDSSSSSKYIFIDAILSRIFEIEGNVEGEKKPYMDGHMNRNFRTKKLLEEYWDGNISDTSSKKKKNKKKDNNKTYDTTEIAALEREVQAKVSTLLEPYSATAKLHNLKLKKRFIYTTEDFEKLTSRPKENYTYTLIVEISHFGETDEKRVVSVDADLIFTHLGKSAYKGVVNKNAEKDLNEILEDVLNTIYQEGIEAYCRNN